MVATEFMDEQKTLSEETLKNQMKPLSENSFVRFFQKILRRWLGVWYGFCCKRPKLSAIIYKVFFFLIFSVGVTVWQFVVMTFLPYAFKGLNDGAAGWPMIPVAAAGGRNFIVFGDEQGWGYFIAFEIAVFTAQCINFPLQRNITYRSHGNPYWQAMWYFIGWVAVSVATNALWGICNIFLLHWGSPDIVNGLVKTLLTGIISMVIFFFLFLIIFPDNQKLAEKYKRRYEKLAAANAPDEKISKAEAKMKEWRARATLSAAEREFVKAKSQLNAKVMSYFAMKHAEEKAKSDEKRALFCTKKQAVFSEAVEAIKAKEEKEKAFLAIRKG